MEQFWLLLRVNGTDRKVETAMSKMTENIVAVKNGVRLEEWKQQIADCSGSGLTVRQWCAQEGIAVGTYYNRLRRVRESVLDNDIVPVCLPKSSGSSDKIEITTEQMKISLPSDVNGNTLALVLQTIKVC